MQSHDFALVTLSFKPSHSGASIMNVIPTKTHAIIDYVFGIVLIVSPFLFDFADGGPAQWIPILVGIIILASSLMTNYEISISRLIPMPVHLVVDVFGRGPSARVTLAVSFLGSCVPPACHIWDLGGWHRRDDAAAALFRRDATALDRISGLKNSRL